MGISRRQFLHSSALAGTTLLSGCCGQGLSFRRELVLEKPTTKILSYPNNTFDKTAPYIPAIDAHTHFFNASDIQAAGYLSGPIANEIPEWKALIQILDPVINFLARNFVPKASEEWKYLDSIPLCQASCRQYFS